MKSIALISDTHSYLGPDVKTHLNSVDEIWHAGDIGSLSLLEELEAFTTVKAVYGNIDDHQIRSAAPLDLFFVCDGVKVFMTHIGGYPGRYTARVKALLEANRPDVYICGHSHICKVVRDHKLELLHMNPGACGHSGFHAMRTMLLFECNKGKVEHLRVVELGKRGRK
ncbi:MAG: metallophosphoesterase family protein [Saprospiraceae bacterium]|nr:metallophosphoesterase family protein [Saprospiraceae bacterium]